ncbi:MAG: hypothetical protein H0X27_07965 [Caulobacteraceae bacterium]|nr:hypothetical protein [Caulobacteraceae bacterium]
MFRWIGWLAPVIVLLSGCGRPASGNPDAAKIAVSPPAAPAALPDNAGYPPDYAAFKAAAAEFAKGETHLIQVDGEPGEARHFDLMDCAEADRVKEPAGQAASPLETLARRVALLQRSLLTAGYPPELFETALRDYERRELAYWAAAAPTELEVPDQSGDRYARALTRLASDIEAARQTRRPDLPAIIVEGGCGAAESPAVIRSDPPGGRVWVITKFAFDVCKASRRDPWDRETCARWSEMDPGRPAELSGNYAYQARWPDGSTGRGTRRIEQAPGDTPAVYLVRKN